MTKTQDKFIDEMSAYVCADFSGLWIVTQEPYEAEQKLMKLQVETKVIHWDFGNGINGVPQSIAPTAPLSPTLLDGQKTLVVLINFHKFIDNPQVLQLLSNAVDQARNFNAHYVIMSPLVHLPAEIEKKFVVVDYPLPTEEDLRERANNCVSKDSQIEEGAISVACGLTSLEAENAFALSLFRKGKILKSFIWDQKVQAIKKSGYLELYRGGESFDSLGGLKGAKHFCLKMLRLDNPITPKGILMVGVPGSGKSAFIKSLGNATGRPVLQMNVGSLHSKYVGESESNIHQALKIADSMSPCILFIDEVEKALSGIGSDGDSGVSMRIFERLLTYLQDHVTNVFVALSANDISRLPPEFTRAERLDRVFFVDLPTDYERNIIWGIWTKHFGIDLSQESIPKDDLWTGAEIKACCRLSAALGEPLEEVAKGIVPIALSSKEKIESLRRWAKGRYVSANSGCVYTGETR